MDDERFPPEQRPLVATLTLGCKLNQAESQAMGRELAAAGCAIIDRPAPADGYLINTCTVTHVADRKARHLIRMARRLSPTAAIVVTGCYAERARDRILAETGADVVLGNGEKQGAAAALLSALEGRPSRSGLKGRDALGRARAFLKIQEGCDDVCSFCIVPKVRGRERAIPISEIVREAQSLERAGALEVVLTGTQPGAYGRDREDGTNAARLLEALLSQTTIPRIRYSSIQPQDVSAEFLAAWEDSRLCRHFHLALQSGSDAVLRRMRRRYDVPSYLEAVGRIRAAAAGAAITTDVIVGFPGETREDFEGTIAAAREVQFADIHVFPYSARPGTGAALLTDDVPPPIKRERVQRVQAEADSGAAKFRRAMVGSVVSVLCEMRKRDGGRTYWAGLTDTYAPVQVAAAGGEDLRNRLTAVCIESLRGGALAGRMLG
ncbi:MAG: tRNA (N(6)-L-threonylcarbamoyladenosine(37)-C(2))-methylthiotransferase MtaB [Dehalococcoidia bacterium]